MISNAMKILSVIAAISLVSLLESRVNTKRYRRSRLFLMIPISFVLMLSGYFFSRSAMPAIRDLCAKKSFFVGAEMAVYNCMLILGYIVFKLIMLPMVTYLSRKKMFQELYAVTLYSFDDDLDEWFLQNKFINFRTYFKAIIWGMVIASGLYLGITWIKGEDSGLWFFSLPCAALVIVLQIFHYVNGITKEECLNEISGEDAQSRRESNYYILREVYEKLIPEPLLTSNSGSDFSGSKTATDVLEDIKDSDEFDEKITSTYFFVNDRYRDADLDSVKATLSMMKGKNVIFFNPFYRDLEMYITLPMVKSLTEGKKCVILCGRRSLESDVKLWISDVMRKYSHMNLLWRVSDLTERNCDCEIGILDFGNIYNKNTLEENREFLQNTGFVLMIEPSIIINTSQIALSILATEMEHDGDHPVYCICDRHTDGIVDTMSHILKSEILDVVAMPVPRCDYTSMAWDADGDFARQKLFDKQTCYFGNGIELGAIAIKNQVPEVSWYSEAKAPVRDIKWIAGQNYSTLCKYMNVPTQQQALYDKMRFISNLWSAPRRDESFIVADDEFCNCFSTMRLYLSRGKKQSFVNVLSENYILRDYMRCNSQMFVSNPNAIPSFVPDYAKTDRNTLNKLLILMSFRPVTEEEAIQQFHLAGIETDDAYAMILQLLRKYTTAPDSIITTMGIHTPADSAFISSASYKIEPEDFEKYFANTLKNAYFIIEDEKNEENYIDAKLFSHVTQMVLPGQYVCYDGKYYMVKYVSPQQGVVLRRASNLFTDRKYYRQIRSYTFDKVQSEEIISKYSIMDICFSTVKVNFKCTTSGYLALKDNHDLRQARVVDLSNDPRVDSYERKYINKAVLKIQLPDTDPSLRFTFCLLINEVFRSLYPHGWQYITAVTDRPEDIDGILNYLVYPVYGELEEGFIYIIEDSEIDLGLLDSVEKNFSKIMSIIADYLDWHFEKMKEPAKDDPLPPKIAEINKKKLKKRNLLTKMFDRLRKIVGPKSDEELEATPDFSNINTKDQKKDKKPTVEEPQVVDEEQEAPEGVAAINIADASKEVDLSADSKDEEQQPEEQVEIHPEDEFVPNPKEDPDIVAIDGTDIFEGDGLPEDNEYFERCFEEMGLVQLTPTRYQKNCYIKYGYEKIDSRIQVEGLRNYLRVRGWCENDLKLARHSDELAKSLLDLNASNTCDFCGLPLSGISFDKLADGRIRCTDCSGSAIQTVEEFRQLFENCLTMMQDVFSIRYRVPIKVEMNDAKVINRGVGIVFKPSTSVAVRTLGYAQKRGKAFSLHIENGCPKLAGISTIVHEMTHIWQFSNWDREEIRAIYGASDPALADLATDLLYEGMATWAEIQYLYVIGEHYFATLQEAVAESRNDVYGVGFKLFRDQYPLVKDSSILKHSPFSTYPPLDADTVAAKLQSFNKLF